jgi:LAO/AO transport system kinase
VLLETVGTGQTDIDIAEVADVRVVVTAPGLGDDIQAMKAGLLEIADILVVNKADREGAERTARDLHAALELQEGAGESWRPPIRKTVASLGQGVDELLEEIERHRAWLEKSGELQTRRRSQLRLRVETILKERVLAAADRGAGLEQEIERAFAAREDPYRVAERVFSGVLRGGGGRA